MKQAVALIQPVALTQTVAIVLQTSNPNCEVPSARKLELAVRDVDEAHQHKLGGMRRRAPRIVFELVLAIIGVYMLF